MAGDSVAVKLKESESCTTWVVPRTVDKQDLENMALAPSESQIAKPQMCMRLLLVPGLSGPRVCSSHNWH